MFQDNNKGKPLPEMKSPNLENFASDGITSLVEKNAKFKHARELKTATSAVSGIAGKVKQDNLTVKEELWENQPTSKIYNAKTIVENQILGINRVVKLKVIIEGKVIKHFKYFKLNQSASSHHTFDLTLASEEVGEDENHDLMEAQNFLGKRLTVVFLYKDVIDGPERTFVGVITEVGYEQDHGSLGNIILSGFDPTILLDAAPHTQSFGGAQAISLNSIADNLMKEGLGTSKYDFRVESAYTKNITYTAQYNETHYNYLARIAEAYGEQFFYDGEVLHFGKLPPQETPVELEYGSNVSDIKVKMRAVHVNPTYYGYNSSKDEKLTGIDSKVEHKSDIANRAYNISKETYKTPSLRVAPIRTETYNDVDASQKGAAGSEATQVFITTGNTSIPYLYPGCIADIKMRKKDSVKTSYFTKLMITECTHEVDAKGYYNGTFKAIAADTGYLPRPEFTSPNAESQPAKVISNSDPLNQGRVQVRFDWQLHDTTDWIRVMTPDAGSSEKVSKNRGFMAIPEVGDQVMVDFIHDNPDRPFVLGGMFHGKVGGGGGAGNNIKSLSSKSGNKLELNDAAGSVFLKDKGGANMKFDGAGNATTNANANHTTNAGSTVVINVGANKNQPAQSVISADSAGNVTIDAKTSITFMVGDNKITINKDGIVSEAALGKIESTAKTGEVIIKSDSSNVTIESVAANTIVKGSVETNLGGGATTNLTGGTVNINEL